MEDIRRKTVSWTVPLLLAAFIAAGDAAAADTPVTAASAAAQYVVDDDGWLRLPPVSDTVVLQHLVIGQGATLLVPPSVGELQLQRLTLKPGARLNIAASDRPFALTVQQAEIAAGSVIAAAGARGEPGQAGGHGRDLMLAIARGQIAGLTVDVRGGAGGQGLPGVAGSAGKNATCWGRGARPGKAGSDGDDGGAGGNGGNLTLLLGQPRWLEEINVLQQGGVGGAGGQPGAAGTGGGAANCWLFSLGREADQGRAGVAGQAAPDGQPGILRTEIHQAR